MTVRLFEVAQVCFWITYAMILGGAAVISYNYAQEVNANQRRIDTLDRCNAEMLQQLRSHKLPQVGASEIVRVNVGGVIVSGKRISE